MDAPTHEPPVGGAPGREITPTDRRLLLFTRLLLALLLIAPWIVGVRTAAWPFVGWTMYAMRTPEYPGSRHSVIAIRAVDSDGFAHEIPVDDIQHFDRRPAAEKVFASLCDPGVTPRDRDADRRYLAARVRAAVPDVSVAEIQIWRRTWHVEPLAVPPLERAAPIEETLLATFAVIAQDASWPIPESELH